MKSPYFTAMACAMSSVLFAGARPGEAATVFASAVAQDDEDRFDSTPARRESDVVSGNTTDPTGPIAKSGFVTASFGDGEDGSLSLGAVGVARYDTTTGEAKVSARASTPVGDEVFNSASARVELGESFSVSGTGSVTFTSAIDGGWSVGPSSEDGPPALSVEYGLFLLSSAPGPFSRVLDQNVVNYSRTNPVRDDSTPGLSLRPLDFTNTVDEILSLTFEVTGNLTYFINQRLSVITSNGLVDFGNTQTLSFTTTGDVTLAFDDPSFLSVSRSDPDTPPDDEPSAVPLPASAFLLIMGLGGFGWIGRRRRSAA